jgi:hypothetical protein
LPFVCLPRSIRTRTQRNGAVGRRDPALPLSTRPGRCPRAGELIHRVTCALIQSRIRLGTCRLLSTHTRPTESCLRTGRNAKRLSYNLLHVLTIHPPQTRRRARGGSGTGTLSGRRKVVSNTKTGSLRASTLTKLEVKGRFLLLSASLSCWYAWQHLEVKMSKVSLKCKKTCFRAPRGALHVERWFGGPTRSPARPQMSLVHVRSCHNLKEHNYEPSARSTSR